MSFKLHNLHKFIASIVFGLLAQSVIIQGAKAEPSPTGLIALRTSSHNPAVRDGQVAHIAFAIGKEELDPLTPGRSQLDAAIVGDQVQVNEPRSDDCAGIDVCNSEALLSDIASGLGSLDVILRYVRDFELVPAFGVQRAPLTTVLDRRGTSFDLTTLTVVLARLQGHSARFGFGNFYFSVEELEQRWSIKIPDAITLFNHIQASRFPANIFTEDGTLQGKPTGAVIYATWAELTDKNTGEVFSFDAAFRKTTFTPPAQQAPSYTDYASEIIQAATDSQPNGVVNAEVTRALLDDIHRNLSDELPVNTTLSDLYGEYVSDDVLDITIERTAALPYASRTIGFSESMPLSFVPVTTISLDILGSKTKLRDFTPFTGPLYPTLTITEESSTNSPIHGIHVDLVEPNGGTRNAYFDYINGQSFAIVSDYEAGSGRLAFAQRHLAEAQKRGDPHPADGMRVLALGHVVSLSQATDLVEKITDGQLYTHGKIGVTTFVGNQGLFVDFPVNQGQLVSPETGAETAAVVFGSLQSLLEGAAIDATLNVDGFSTIKLLSEAISSGDRLLDLRDTLDLANANLTIPDHVNADISSELANGARVLIPENGSYENWTGTAFVSLKTTETSARIRHALSNHYFNSAKGGATQFPVSEEQLYGGADLAYRGPAYWDGEIWRVPGYSDPLDSEKGHQLLQFETLSTGSNGTSLGLTICYNSGDFLKNTSGLGFGWTHNHNIRKVAGTDFGRGFGEKGTAINTIAAAMMIGLTIEFSKSNEQLASHSLTILTADWLREKLLNNSIVIDRGCADSEQFIRTATGWQPLLTSGSKLTEDQSGNFVYAIKGGEKFHFESDQVSTVTDRYGNETQYHYADTLARVTNEFQRILSFQGVESLDSVTDDSNRVVHFNSHDARNLHGYDDPEGNTTSFRYLSDGVLNQLKYEQEVAFTNTAFDSWQRITAQENAAGHVWRFAYGDGFRSQSTTPQEAVTQHFFRSNIEVQTVDSEHAVTRKYLDSQSRVSAIVDPMNVRTEYEYDEYSNIVAEHSIPTGCQRNEDCSIIVRKIYERADCLHPTSIIDGDGFRTDHNLNAQCDIEQETGPPLQNGIRPIFTTRFNDRGLLELEVDTTGLERHHFYDPKGNIDRIEFRKNAEILSTETFTPTDTGDIETHKTTGGIDIEYLYDNNRELVETIDHASAASRVQLKRNHRGRVTEEKRGDEDSMTLFKTLKYNELDQLTEEIDAQNSVTRYLHTDDGYLEQVVDPDNVIRELRRDSRGDIIAIATNPGTSETVIEFKRRKDRQISATIDEYGGRTDRIYDQFNRLVGICFPERNVANQADRSDCHSFHLDKRGFSTGFTTRKGQHIVENTDTNGELITMSTPEANYRFEKDAMGRLTDIVGGDTIVSNRRSPLGHIAAINFTYPSGRSALIQTERTDDNDIAAITYPDGTRIDYKFDGAKRPTKVLLNDELLASYDWDPVSRALDTATLRSNMSIAVDYHDDGLIEDWKLKQDNSVVMEFAYDYSEGNRLTTLDADEFYTAGPGFSAQTNLRHDFQSRPTEISGQAINYDENANISLLPTNGAELTFIHDSQNRIASINKGTEIVRYYYFGDGRLASKILSDGTVLEYQWVGNQLVSVMKDGQLVKKLVPVANSYVAEITGDGLFYLVIDPRTKSIIAKISEQGQIVQRSVYDLTGDTQTSFDDASLGYGGGIHDQLSKCTLLGARTYCPQIASFLEPDPLVADTLTVGTSAYELGGTDLTNYADPSGNIPIVFGVLAIKFAIGATSGAIVESLSGGDFTDITKSALKDGALSLIVPIKGAPLASFKIAATSLAKAQRNLRISKQAKFLTSVIGGIAAGGTTKAATKLVRNEFLPNQANVYDPRIPADLQERSIVFRSKQ